MISPVDVVIVGAGAAGLSAARTAPSHGLSFVLLEASHRIGERAQTVDLVPGRPLDLGCHWMHSASLNPIVGIAERLGFRSFTSCLTDRVIATTWHGDPWALGAYSGARPGQAHQRAVLARPVDDRLFFAGEATSREFFCTCHGAYLTGQRAMGEIAAVLRGSGAAR